MRKRLELGSDYEGSDEDEDEKKVKIGSVPKTVDEDEENLDNVENEAYESDEDDEEYYSEEGKQEEDPNEMDPAFILENDGANVFNPLMYFA